MENLDRLFQADYVPSNQDILFAKSKTIGVLETLFEWQGLKYRIIDVGERPSARTKWMSAFDGIDVLLFVASMSAYDLFTAEFPGTVSLAICIAALTMNRLKLSKRSLSSRK